DRSWLHGHRPDLGPQGRPGPRARAAGPGAGRPLGPGGRARWGLRVPGLAGFGLHAWVYRGGGRRVVEPMNDRPQHGAPSEATWPWGFDDAFSTPLGAPLVPRFPIRFRDTTILSVAYRTDAAAVARFLP